MKVSKLGPANYFAIVSAIGVELDASAGVELDNFSGVSSSRYASSGIGGGGVGFFFGALGLTIPSGNSGMPPSFLNDFLT